MAHTTYVRIGMGALSTLANISYAGMRAQNDPNNEFPRMLTFIVGLPYSIVTLACVGEGSNKAYGIHLPPPSHTRYDPTSGVNALLQKHTESMEPILGANI